jgi:PAS domain S-box-containing protein
VLETAAQPIWVVDPDDRLRFANPAAIAALGYDNADELFGRNSHETIHYKHPDGSPYPAADCPLLLPRTTGERVSSELDWFFRSDGSMFAVSYQSVPIEMPEGRGAVVAFTDIDERMRAERTLREHDAVLAGQQASLRRVTTLVAGGASSAEVFSAIAKEVAHVLGLRLVHLWRYEPDGTATVLGAWGERPQPYQVGSNWRFDEGTVVGLVEQMRAGRPVRIDDFSELAGATADAGRAMGITATAGAPIVVDGKLWGLMGAAALDREALPDHIEDRLAEFTDLVATAISNTTRGEELARLADEQAALRRVATLIARESPAAEVFAAVAEELGRLLDVDSTRLVRYDEDRTATVVSTWGPPVDAVPVGTRMPLGGINVISLVAENGQACSHRRLRERHRRHRGVRAPTGCPVRGRRSDRRRGAALGRHDRQLATARADAGRHGGMDRGVRRADRDGGREHPGTLGPRRIARADRRGGRRRAPAGRPRSP